MRERGLMKVLTANRVKRRLKEGQVCYGTMLRTISSVHAVPLAASSGWDFAILDTEHCDFDTAEIASLALVARYEEMSLLVRVPDKEYHLMARNLDLGVDGLVLPRVDTPDQVSDIIRATKYGPLGQRGASISTVSTRFRSVSGAEYLEWANRELINVIQIESEEGVNRVDELVASEGVDAVLIGPFDLSQSFGIPGQLSHPRMQEAYREVIRGCAEHGVASGAHLQTVEEVSKWVGEGMRFVTFQYDSKLFQDASINWLSQLRQIESGSD